VIQLLLHCERNPLVVVVSNHTMHRIQALAAHLSFGASTRSPRNRGIDARTTSGLDADQIAESEPLRTLIEKCSVLALDRKYHSEAKRVAQTATWIPYIEKSHYGCSPEAVAALPSTLVVSAQTRAQFRRVVASIGVETSYNVLNMADGNMIDGTHYMGDFAVGKWDENRENIYNSGFYDDGAGGRTIHLGCDLFDVAGTPIHAFYDGEVALTGHYPGANDYGFVVILKHVIDGQDVWSLHGHLSPESLQGKFVGQKLKAGEVVGWIGQAHNDINGGWVPHLHFQLSLLKPRIADWPGVVSKAHREVGRRVYPDPRQVLGQLWQ